MASQPSTPLSKRASPSSPARSPKRTPSPKAKPRYDVFNSFAFHKFHPSDSLKEDTSGSASLLEEIDFIQRAAKSPSPAATPRRARVLSQSVESISEDHPASWEPVLAAIRKADEPPAAKGDGDSPSGAVGKR
jgi:hypothetical protein